ncbi:MAG: M48 family metallopeptidase [Phycisphaerales bacterium]|nr:M48 family metallopeptidase [Phycisphaerales bacterium]
MSTNFFEQQDKARKRTGLLVTCFVSGIILMTVVLYAVAMVVFNASGFDEEQGFQELQVQYWNGGVLAIVAGVVILLVGGSSLFKIIELRSGGRVVADMLGAKQLNPATRNHRERVAQNVVEEMAIASGTPVPPLYILEDDSINAFAAGWSPNDAVISLNRGTINTLSRDELQGVVAHEFSHIFNGDMRINIRLIGVIHGLMVLGVTGWLMVRFIGPLTMRSGGRSSSKNDGGGAAIGIAIMLFGLAMALCGFIGTFFGRLVQAAVSRQREFLADASAVQYTRNPDGIGGALRMISSVGRGHAEDLPEKASEISHMFFAKAMNSMFATHPPLSERIARVEGMTVEQVRRQLQEQRLKKIDRPKPLVEPVTQSGVDRQQATRDVLGAVILGSVLDDAMSKIGTVDKQSLEQSSHILGSIPEPVKDAAHSAATARLVVFSLILDQDESDRALQWNKLKEILNEFEFKSLQRLEEQMRTLDAWARMPLLDLCIPALSQMSENQYKQFRSTLDMLVRLDGKLDQWEWVVDTILDRHLEERYHKPGAERRARAQLRARRPAVNTVLATLACSGAEDEDEAEAAFAAATDHLGWREDLPDPRSLTLRTLRSALREVRTVRFTDRKSFLEACEICILHDGQTTPREAELLRAIAESIDCPMPLLTARSE